MIYTYDYDSNYVPAMPIVEVVIRRVAQEEGMTLTALVDSGSDATMIPLRFLKQIQARKARQTQIRGVAGFSYIADMYRIFLQVGPYRTSRLSVVADRQNQQMILGRDVLNYMIVTLNGLASTVELSH